MSRIVEPHTTTSKMKPWLYRLLAFALAGLAVLLGQASQITRDFNAYYFPHQAPPSFGLFWVYAPCGIGILLLIEGLFLFGFRRFFSRHN